MVKFFPRFSKKETGQISVKDGKWKMEVKERFRLIGIITAAFTAIFIIAAIFFPYFVAAIVAIYAITTGLLAGVLDGLQWTGRRLVDSGKWAFQWGIRQPINDFKYGRRKRKELEDTRTYAE